MLWLLEVLSSCLLGYEVTTLLTSVHWEFLIRVAAGIPVGFFSFAWFVFLTSRKYPMNLTHGVIVVLLFLALTVILYCVNMKRRPSMIIRLDYWQQWTFILAGFLIFVVMFASMLMGGTSTKGAAYSDLPFHLNIISSLAHGRSYIRKDGMWDIWTPFFNDERLAYPIMANYHSAALVSTGGATLRQALFIPSLLMMISLILGVFFLARYYTSSTIGAALSVVLFLGLGGLGFLILFDNNGDTMNRTDFVHCWTDQIHEFWLQTLMHILVPQRSALWAGPLCYFSIFALIIGIQKDDLKMMLFAGLLTGLTPQAQGHAYVSMAQWSILFCVFTFPFRRAREWKSAIMKWAVFAITANIMALPQLPPFFKRAVKENQYFMKLNPVWNMGPKRGVKWAPLVLWWRGLGVFGAIALLFGWATATKKQMQVYAPSVIVWFIGNFIRYQLWEMDNIKVFYDAWIPLAVPFVAQYILFFIKMAKRGKRSTLNMLIAAMIVVTCTASGFMCILTYMSSSGEIFDECDIAFGNWIAENTATDDVFLTAQTTAQPVATLGGRQLFMGFVGWVVSHGIPDRERSSRINTLLTHPENTQNFIESSIKYVVEENDFQFKATEEWELVYEDEHRRVWKLSGA